MAHIVQDPVYQQLTCALPDMLRTVRAKVSVTIGVNLDDQFRPVAATLLSVNDQRFTASTFLDRLLGGMEKVLGALAHSIRCLLWHKDMALREGGATIATSIRSWTHSFATWRRFWTACVSRSPKRYATMTRCTAVF